MKLAYHDNYTSIPLMWLFLMFIRKNLFLIVLPFMKAEFILKFFTVCDVELYDKNHTSFGGMLSLKKLSKVVHKMNFQNLDLSGNPFSEYYRKLFQLSALSQSFTVKLRSNKVKF